MRPFILLTLLTLLAPAALLAQRSDSTAFDLEQVVVSENRLELPFSDQSRHVTVLRREDILALPAVSLAEVLQFVSGVDVRQRGVHGVQADLSLRGSTFDQVLLLVNGVRLSDPQTGHHLMNLPLDPEQVERIEIMQGAGARIWGQNAFAGAVNIVTRRPEGPALTASLRAGDHGLGGVSLAADLAAGGARHRVALSRDFAGGYRPNTDYDMTSAWYQGELDLRRGSVRLMAGHTDRRFGANGFYANPSFAKQFEAVQTTLVAMDGRTDAGAWTLRPRVWWRRNQDEYLFDRYNPSVYRNVHIGSSAGAELHARRPTRLGSLGAGVEIGHVALRSNNLGAHQRYTAAAFLEHRFILLDGRLDLTPGLSISHFSDFGTRVFPGIDAGMRLGSGWKAFASAGQTYRVPTFTDLYYSDPANAGNPDLQPESAFSWEAGASYLRGNLRLQASWFERLGRDLIDWTRDADTLRWQPRNFRDLDMRGVDLSAEMLVGRGILQSLRLGYTHIDASFPTEGQTNSRYALNHLAHQATAGLRLGHGPLSLQVQARNQERIGGESDLLLDARLAARLGAVSAWVEATNLTDEAWTGANLVPMPGRWLRAGIRYAVAPARR